MHFDAFSTFFSLHSFLTFSVPLILPGAIIRSLLDLQVFCSHNRITSSYIEKHRTECERYFRGIEGTAVHCRVLQCIAEYWSVVQGIAM